jgi:glycosyltransferase involved in cell wall biosynthesis
MQLSIVIPLFNEAESLPELHDWLVRVLDANQLSYEILFIDDGSKDASWQTIVGLRDKNQAVKGLRFQRNYGKSAALQVGFEAAKGDVVITMDADLQDSPDEIPELYRMITEDDLDVVSG